MSGFEASAVLHAALYFLAFSAIPSIIAWVWCVVMCRRHLRPVPWARGLLTALLAFLICFATLSWSPQGHDYSVAQVVVSGVLMVALTVLVVYRGQPRQPLSILALWGLIFGYSLCWSLVSGPSDSTGLWGAGLIFLCLGLTFGLAVVIIVTFLVATRLESRRL